MKKHSLQYDFLGKRCTVSVGIYNPEELTSAINHDSSHLVLLYDTKLEEEALKLCEALDLKTSLGITGGESTKTWEQLQTICEHFMPHINRNTKLIVLGGGTIGDIGGLAAALLLRGIDWIYIPTTLLAMVDSSIAGKTAINSRYGKNLVGAFHAPTQVIANINYLETLPERDLNAGYVELIKHALIADKNLFTDLSTYGGGCTPNNLGDMAAYVFQSMNLKLDIINGDWLENQGSSREFLNLGHTFAHGFEFATNYKLLHGEAVGYGLMCAYLMAEKLGYCPSAEVNAVIDFLTKLPLPKLSQLINDINRVTFYENCLQAMQRDKKNTRGDIKLILPKGIGEGCLSTKAQTQDILFSIQNVLVI